MSKISDGFIISDFLTIRDKLNNYNFSIRVDKDNCFVVTSSLGKDIGRFITMSELKTYVRGVIAGIRSGQDDE